MGYEGFSGNESILYHLQSPCRVAAVGSFEPIRREEWVPDAHVHRLTNTAPLQAGGDPVFGRRLLMFNADVELGICKPTEELDAFYRSGEGDEVLFIHEGTGALETVFGRLPFGAHDYVVIRADDVPRAPRPRTAHVADVLHAGGDRDADPLPQPLRPAAGARALLAARLHAPGELETHREPWEGELVVRVRGGFQRFELDYHPLDVVGWDGYVYPYTFNIADFEPKSGRLHQPPPGAPDLPGPELRDLLVLPARAGLGPARGAAPVPPLKPPVRGGHLLRRRPVRVASRPSTSARSPAPERPAARAAAGPGGERRSALGGPRSSRSCATRSGR